MFTKKSVIFLLAMTLVCCLGVFESAQAQTIPHEISFQGVLRNDDGTLFNDGNHKMKFSLATSEAATSFIWLEVQNLPTVNGVFNARLGAVTPFTFDFDTDLWLEVATVVGASYIPVGPRIQLAPSPSALYALKVPANSITSNELAAGAAVESLNAKTGAVNLVAGTNVSISPSGNNLVISATASGGGDDGDWTIGANDNMTYEPDATVTIGSYVPLPLVNGQAHLQITGDTSPALTLDNLGSSRWSLVNQIAQGELHIGYTNAPFEVPAGILIVDNDGQVGIGHTPEVTLDIDGGNYMLTDTNHGDFQIGSNGNYLQFGVDVDGTNAGRAKIRAIGTAPFLNFDVNTTTLSLRNDKLHLYTDGTKRVELWGGDANDLGGQLFMYGTGSTATVELDGHNNFGGHVGVKMESGIASASMASTSSGGEIVCRNAAGAITVSIDGQYSDGYGRVQTQVLEITGGSDLSEQFRVSPTDRMKALEPGLVVSIDPHNPGELQVCQTAYDHKVAGVISGAGGVRPGMLMGQKGSVADGDHPVALTGRVYVRADATGGVIEPGDLLTTSDVAGHAMKVTDHNRANGAILGKAMTGLADGQGLVLVLVSLQ